MFCRVTHLCDYTEQFKTFGTGQGAMLIAAGDMPADVRSYEMNPDSNRNDGNTERSERPCND